VVVFAHSWGDTVFRLFMSWVEVQQPGWVEAHVAVFTNIAGPTLGAPKALSFMLSGDFPFLVAPHRTVPALIFLSWMSAWQIHPQMATDHKQM